MLPLQGNGAAEMAKSPVSMAEFEALEISAGFTEEDHRHLDLRAKCLQPNPNKLSITGAAVSSPAYPTSPGTLASRRTRLRKSLSPDCNVV
jgi:hypothetical protein